jgi:hypothetical protein
MKRLHMSNSEEINLNKVYHLKEYAFKPNGLWYAENNEWFRWCHSEMPHWIKPNIFELDIDMSKILVLSNVRGLKLFNYAYSKSISGDLQMIDWAKVQKEYKGIEIRNYYDLKWNHDLREFNIWFYGWDVPGGCIWDLSAIRRIKKYSTPKKYFQNNLKIRF